VTLSPLFSQICLKAMIGLSIQLSVSIYLRRLLI